MSDFPFDFDVTPEVVDPVSVNELCRTKFKPYLDTRFPGDFLLSKPGDKLGFYLYFNGIRFDIWASCFYDEDDDTQETVIRRYVSVSVAEKLGESALSSLLDLYFKEHFADDEDFDRDEFEQRAKVSEWTGWSVVCANYDYATGDLVEVERYDAIHDADGDEEHQQANQRSDRDDKVTYMDEFAVIEGSAVYLV